MLKVTNILQIERNGKIILLHVKDVELMPSVDFIEDIEIIEDKKEKSACF